MLLPESLIISPQAGPDRLASEVHVLSATLDMYSKFASSATHIPVSGTEAVVHAQAKLSPQSSSTASDTTQLVPCVSIWCMADASMRLLI
jgi:hypothetical protein